MGYSNLSSNKTLVFEPFLITLSLFLLTKFTVNAQSYCDPNHYGAYHGFCVASVTIGAWTQSNAGGDGQKNDYTGGTDAVMVQGTDYNFSVDFTEGLSGSYGYIFIDWNDDGDFSDASEFVLNAQAVGVSPGTTTWKDATYTCPTIATGTVRMRVISSAYSTGHTDGCYAWDYGEYEDYEIVVTAAAGPNVKDDNTTNLNAAGSWTTSVPTSSEVATWENTVTGSNTTSLGADVEFQGVAIDDPGGLVTINSGNTLTIGTDGVDMADATQSLTMNNAVALGANQNWDVNTSRTLTAGGVVSGAYKIDKDGAGTLTLSGTNTFTGGLDHNAGTLNVNAAAALGTTAGTLTLTS